VSDPQAAYVAREAARVAAAAQRQGQGPLVYLPQVLELEVADRAAAPRRRRRKEAGVPWPKTLASVDFGRAPALPEVQLRRIGPRADYNRPGGNRDPDGRTGDGQTPLSTLPYR